MVKLLDSENNAERFLAVIVCERLTELNKINLTQASKEKIEKIYSSTEMVSVCSGCAYWDTLSLKDILKTENKMRISANNWLDKTFKN